MYPEENLKNDLYLYAIELFQASGNAATSDVIFTNHTPEQFVYFDCQEEVAFSQLQRKMINNVSCISHLFDIQDETFDRQGYGSIGFYSMEMLCSKSLRSQTAYDIHCLFQRVFPTKASIILFRHNRKILLSMQGFDSDVYLSDWFDEEGDFDVLVNSIHICNMSLHSARDYFYDFVYSIARWYYIYPITKEAATYLMFPIDYFLEYENDIARLDRETLMDQIFENFRLAEADYGDDFVEPGITQQSIINVGAELDLIALELDINDMGNDEEYLDETDELGEEYDEEETEDEDFDNDIFEDPTLMVRFLERNAKDDI